MNWKEKLTKWCEENPSPPCIPLEMRDTSGSMSRETMLRISESMEDLLASGEIDVVYIQMDDDGNPTIVAEYGDSS